MRFKQLPQDAQPQGGLCPHDLTRQTCQRMFGVEKAKARLERDVSYTKGRP